MKKKLTKADEMIRVFPEDYQILRKIRFEEDISFPQVIQKLLSERKAK